MGRLLGVLDRAGAKLVGLVVAVALVAVGGVIGVPHVIGGISRQFTWDGGDGGQRVAVDLPRRAGKPTFTKLEVPVRGMPLGLRAAGTAVRIEAGSFGDATGTLTMGFGEEVDPDKVVVMRLSPEFGIWMPVEGEVDPVRREVTVHTRHLSDWVVAETDPVAYKAAIAARVRSTKGISGALLTAMYGKADAVRCDSRRLLLPAKIRFEAGLPGDTTQVCEEVLEDGSYRLDVANKSNLPILLKLPAGFRIEKEPELMPTVRELIDRFSSGQYSKDEFLLPPQQRIAVLFAGTAVPTPAIEIHGTVSWTAAVAELVFEAVTTVLGEPDKNKDPTQLQKLFQHIATTTSLNDCLASAANEIGKTIKDGVSPKQIRDVFVNVIGNACKSFFKDLLVDALSPRSIARAIVSPWDVVQKEVNKVKDLMSLARRELDLMLGGLNSLGGVDMGMVVRPVRVMSAAEALRLHRPCGAPAAEAFLPAGAPASTSMLCSAVTDLDGNQRDDVLILWRRPLRYAADIDYGTGRGFRSGAVAYLDDDSFHLMEGRPFEPDPKTKRLALAPTWLGPLQAIAGPDGRRLVGVQVKAGSSTSWTALLTVADRRLNLLQNPAGTPFVMPRGGAAGYSSGHGCVVQDGRQLLGLSSRATDPIGSRYDYLAIDLYEIDGLTVKSINQGLGTIRDTTGAPPDTVGRPWFPGLSGYKCDGAAGDVGSAVASASTPEKAVTDLIGYAAAKNTSAGWRRIAADNTLIPAPKPEQLGRYDVWRQLTRAFMASDWTSAKPTCTAQKVSQERAGAVCTVAAAKPGKPKLEFFLVDQTKSGAGWMVFSAGPPLSADNLAANESFHAKITRVEGDRVTVNKVLWFNGAQAVKACREDGQQSSGEFCSGYYARDRNPQTYTYPVDPGAKTVVFDYRTNTFRPVPVDQWLVSVQNSETLYWQMVLTKGRLSSIRAVPTS